jgi:hypothetical protein
MADYPEYEGKTEVAPNKPSLANALESLDECLRRLDAAWERHRQCIDFVLRPGEPTVDPRDDQLTAVRVRSVAVERVEQAAATVHALVDRIQLTTDRLDT